MGSSLEIFKRSQQLLGEVQASCGGRELASGDVKIAKMAIEIVDLPMINWWIFHSYVSLPEGRQLELGQHPVGTWDSHTHIYMYI